MKQAPAVTEIAPRASGSSGCAPRRRRVRCVATHARVAATCRALGDENRLTMLQMIAEAGELCACEIEAHFALSQPTISHHLKQLRSAGLIEGERRGNWIYYRVVDAALRNVTEHPVFQR